MKNIFLSLKNKSAGYWLGVGAAVAAVVICVALCIVNADDHVFTHIDENNRLVIVVYIFLALGVIAEITGFFVNTQLLRLFSTLCYAVSFAQIACLSSYTASDVLLNNSYFKGDFNACIGFSVAMLVVLAICIASCFMTRQKENID